MQCLKILSIKNNLKYPLVNLSPNMIQYLRLGETGECLRIQINKFNLRVTGVSKTDER